jgi:methionine sulfoxide reductase heme-binding subunit
MTSGSALWSASGATGVICLILLSLVTILGILVNQRGRLPGLPRFAVTGLHRNLSMLMVVFLGVHIVTAITARHAPIPWVSTVVPFISGYQRFWVGLGAVAVDLVAALVVTSLLRDRLAPSLWRRVHWLSYAAYPVTVAHSYGSHEDIQSGWLLVLTAATVLSVVTAAAYRVSATIGAVSRPRRVRLRPHRVRLSRVRLSRVRLSRVRLSRVRLSRVRLSRVRGHLGRATRT